MGKKKFLLFLLFFLMLAGCMKKVDLGVGFDRTSKNFLQTMRWQSFQDAAGYLKPEARAALLETFAENGDLHIVEADYTYTRLDAASGSAESRLRLKYYLLPSTRIREWIWDMNWELLPLDTKQRGTWQVGQAPPPFP